MMPEKDYVGCQAIWVVGEFHSLRLFVPGLGGGTKNRVMGMSCGFRALLFASHNFLIMNLVPLSILHSGSGTHHLSIF